MKKYFLSIAVMAIFAIGFAASDETESSISSSNSSPQTEQKQETQKQESEAERKAREKKEKIEKAKERGKFWGKMAGQNSMREAYAKGDYCKERFISEFGTPSTDEDFELYTDYFKEAYCDSYDETIMAKSRM